MHYDVNEIFISIRLVYTKLCDINLLYVRHVAQKDMSASGAFLN